LFIQAPNTCGGLPLPPPKLYLPGLARISSMKSFRLSALTVFETISTTGTRPVIAIGSKSSITEYLFFDMCGTITASAV
jgi:hypothetical protein